MKFSERYGYKKVREVVQLESIDEPLRNALWSLLKLHVWDHVHYSSGIYGGYYLSNNEVHKVLCERLWFNYFKKPLDTLDNDWSEVLKFLRDYFFKCKWYESYDFIEFIVNNYDKYGISNDLVKGFNHVLTKEVAAYRFIDKMITRITEKEQVDEIETALETSRGAVFTHLKRGLELLSDREKPDYRNSIKESISAVESLVGNTVGEKGTLGQLLIKLENEILLHPALKKAFSSLYGYTSDEGGIRHAILDSEKINFEDAKFFLVICSAFVNFVQSKSGTAGGRP